jgi:hypothetical protein
MRKSLAIAMGTLFLLTAGTPFAQTAKGPVSKPNVTAAQSGSMMTIGAQMGQMDEHMAKMQTLHDKMASAATPEERQGVMQDQRQEMQRGMTMMHDMHQGDSPMGGAGMGNSGQTGKPVDPKVRMQMMEKRIDMMQMMMQSMQDQQGTMAGPKGSPATSNK